MIKFFIPEKQRVGPNSVFIWTALSGCIYAASSFIYLILVTRILGAVTGGIFSIALAISQQMITVGWFNTRKFQASDIQQTYCFTDYIGARIITTAIMLLAGAAWVFAGNFTPEKRYAALLLIAFKASEAFSDVFAGRYQQKGRFDVACRILFTKTTAAILVFFIVLFVFRNLNSALWAMLLLHLLLTFVIDGYVLSRFENDYGHISAQKIFFLLSACFPLFINSFLQMYLNNAPKYAVNQFCSEKDLAVYSVLSMLSFLVALLADFIINPQITAVANLYNSGNDQRFKKILRNQVVIVLFIGVLAILFTRFWGIQILSLLFGFPLGENHQTVSVLILAGTLFALYQISQLILIVIRKQTWCLLGIFFAAASAFFTGSLFVPKYGIFGAALSYTISMAILLIIFSLLAFRFLHLSKKIPPCESAS